jgi:hypothetical protein
VLKPTPKTQELIIPTYGEKRARGEEKPNPTQNKNSDSHI